jgi:hypothetical protein
MGNPKIIPLKSVYIAHILKSLKCLFRSGFKISDQVPRFNAGLQKCLFRSGFKISDQVPRFNAGLQVNF